MFSEEEQVYGGQDVDRKTNVTPKSRKKLQESNPFEGRSIRRKHLNVAYTF